MLLTAFALSQSKPKKESGAPTQKEMDDMMKKAQEAVRNIVRETKRMLDSMGVKNANGELKAKQQTV